MGEITAWSEMRKKQLSAGALFLESLWDVGYCLVFVGVGRAHS